MSFILNLGTRKIYIFSIEYASDLKFKMNATDLDRNQLPLTKQDCFA